MTRSLFRRWGLLTILLCLTGARTAMAQDAQLILAARATAKPNVLVWVDKGQETGFDEAAAST
jgi:hypothetical protein